MKSSITTITIFILIWSGLSLAQNYSTAPAPAIPDEPVQPGEAFQGRVRSTSATNSPTEANVSSLPAIPVRRRGESEAAFQARLRAWESQVRQIIYAPKPSEPVSVPATPDRPVQRRGESDAAYQARLLQWQNQVEKQQDVLQLQQELQRLVRPSRTSGTINTRGAGSFDVFGEGTGNILVIPTEEMKTKSFIAINEDMNVMSQIFSNELKQNGMIYSGYGAYGAAINLELTTNNIKSMYLQGYGALFMIKVDFPLSAPPEVQKQPQEPNKGEVDRVWQQTKEQIYEPQVASAYSYRRTAENLDVKYDAQKVENLKKILITALKHASNIEILKPDESVILRISEISTSRSSIKAILGDQYFIQTGNGGNWVQNGGNWVLKEDLPDNIKNLPDEMKLLPPPPNAIVIRAKKSDIDAYAKGELDFDKFRDKTQVFSYPIVGDNSGN